MGPCRTLCLCPLQCGQWRGQLHTAFMGTQGVQFLPETQLLATDHHLFQIWKGLGYGSVIYLSVISGIEQEVYESARIDGATKWQQVRHITLPMIRPTFILLIMFNLGSILKGQFQLFYQLVGNNGILFNVTDIIDTYVYRSLTVNFDIGMGSAAGVFQSVFGCILVLSVNTIVRRVSDDLALF